MSATYERVCIVCPQGTKECQRRMSVFVFRPSHVVTYEVERVFGETVARTVL